MIILSLTGISFEFLAILFGWIVLVFVFKRHLETGLYTLKRITAFFLIIFILSFVLIGQADSYKRPNMEKWKNTPNQNFSSNFSTSENQLLDYASQENYIEMSYSGPFYIGNFPGNDEYTKKYFEARNERAKLILVEMGEAVDALNNLENSIKDVRGLYLDFAFMHLAYDNTQKEDILNLLDSTTTLATLNNSKLQHLNSLKDGLFVTNKNAEWGFLTYSLYAGIQDLMESYSTEIVKLNKKLLASYLILSQNPNLSTEIIKMDTNLEGASLVMDDYFKKASNLSGLLTKELRLLNTADYYFAIDILAYMEKEIPNLRYKLDSYDNSKQILTPEMIDYLKETINNFEIYSLILKEYVNEIDQNSLLPDNQVTFHQDTIFPKVYALGNPFQWLGSTIKDATVGTASLAWSATKTVAGTVKDTVITGAKATGIAVGAVLDTVDAGVKTAVDTVQGIYYLDDPRVVRKQIKDHFSKVYTNFQEAKSGSEIYKNATAGMEGAEEFAKNIVDGAVKATWGEGRISNSLGFIAKTTAGFFTGLAKDSYTILDPTKSDSETLTSMASLLMTAAGGSQSIMKGAEALSKGKELFKGGLKSFLEKGLNIGKNLSLGGFKETFSKIFSRNSLSTLGELSAKIGKNTADDLLSFGKDGFKSLYGRAFRNVPEAYQGLFKPDSFKNLFKTVLGVAEEDDTVSKMAVGYFNNLIGSVTDSAILEQNKTALEYFGVSSQGIADLEELEKENRLELLELMERQVASQYNIDFEAMEEAAKKDKEIENSINEDFNNLEKIAQEEKKVEEDLRIIDEAVREEIKQENNRQEEKTPVVVDNPTEIPAESPAEIIEEKPEITEEPINVEENCLKTGGEYNKWTGCVYDEETYNETPTSPPTQKASDDVGSDVWWCEQNGGYFEGGACQHY